MLSFLSVHLWQAGSLRSALSDILQEQLAPRSDTVANFLFFPQPTVLLNKLKFLIKFWSLNLDEVNSGLIYSLC